MVWVASTPCRRSWPSPRRSWRWSASTAGAPRPGRPKGIPVVERFRYLYDADELGEWVPRIRQAAGSVKNLHLLMNNCYANYGTTNAREIAAMLSA